MKWIGRISLILAFVCLAILATLPYLEPVRQKWQRFQEAWKLVNRDLSAVEEAEIKSSESEATEATRERSILLPGSEPDKTEPDLVKNEDPFLAETRRRARENPEAAMVWTTLFQQFI